jgi:hypothetical protein
MPFDRATAERLWPALYAVCKSPKVIPSASEAPLSAGWLRAGPDWWDVIPAALIEAVLNCTWETPSNV